MRPRKAYCICSDIRSGSSLFADGLAATGIAGIPEEYFTITGQTQLSSDVVLLDRQSIQQQLEEAVSRLPENHLETIISQGSTPNGVFGVKIQHHQIPIAAAMLRRHLGLESNDLSLYELLSLALSTVSYIFLTRRDKISQAVSCHAAAVTGRFYGGGDISSYKAAERQKINQQIPYRDQLGPDDFSYTAIQRYLSLLKCNENSWTAFFRRYGIRPLVLDYEDFVKQYEETLARSLRYLDLQVENARFPQPTLRRQSDVVTAEWKQRFIDIQQARKDAGRGMSSIP